jgi:ABC-2 type transport system permease protein
MNLRYLVIETRRVVRSPRFLITTVGMPVAFYLLFSSMGGKGDPTAKAVMMAGMAGFGGLTAAVSTGARIAAERAAGWQRQLRLTPLPPSAYLVAKALLGMLVALGPMLLVYGIGVATGVHLDAGEWALLVVGTWLALTPLAVLGVLVGQIATPDSVQAIGGATFMLLSLGGGLWFPPDAMPAWLQQIAHALPSYWMGGIGRDVVQHHAFQQKAIWVLLAWTVGLGIGVARRFRAQTARA